MNPQLHYEKPDYRLNEETGSGWYWVCTCHGQRHVPKQMTGWVRLVLLAIVNSRHQCQLLASFSITTQHHQPESTQRVQTSAKAKISHGKFFTREETYGTGTDCWRGGHIVSCSTLKRAPRSSKTAPF